MVGRGTRKRVSETRSDKFFALGNHLVVVALLVVVLSADLYSERVAK